MSSKILDIYPKNNKWFVSVYDSKTNANKMMLIKFSKRKGKKYDVYELKYNPETNKITPKYKLSFGSSTNQHYFDKLEGYEELNHNDEERRERYYNRFKDHDGNIESAKFWSHGILW